MLGGILSVVAEVLLNGVVELVLEIATRLIPESWRQKLDRAFLAAIFWALLGAALGGLSLQILPSMLIADEEKRIVTLVVAPLVVGLVMTTVGALRRRRGEALVRLDTFAFAWLFAFAFTGVRYLLAK